MGVFRMFCLSVISRFTGKLCSRRTFLRARCHFRQSAMPAQPPLFFMDPAAAIPYDRNVAILLIQMDGDHRVPGIPGSIIPRS